MQDLIGYQREDNLAVLTMDDGKANALSHDMIKALQGALDRAEKEEAAVLLCGRERRLSAGFDLATMTKSAADARQLITAGAELLLRLYQFPRPVVIACTGHALAAGALLLLAVDERIGAQGDFKLGLNEVAIQLPLPMFAIELARDRLSKRHFSAATMQARIYDPDSAVDAGYLDLAVAPEKLDGVARERAHGLAALPGHAFRLTKVRSRQAVVQTIRATLQADIERLLDPPSA